jgi:hypothetical protein
VGAGLRVPQLSSEASRHLLDEALLAIILVCLTPACGNFLYIAASTIRGYPLWAFPYTVLQAGLIFGSATLIGPIGLAATIWTVLSPAHRPGTNFMVVLWTLTAWATAMLRLPAQYPFFTHVRPGTELPTVLLNLVLLPALAVALLHTVEGRRRRVAG